MKVAIHQPHFLPWMGYFDKMAKADVFVLLDEVQLEDRSPMLRNKLLNFNGEVQYVMAHVNKKGYRDKPCCEITLAYDDKWNEKTLKFLELNYKRSEFFVAVFDPLYHVFSEKKQYLIDVQLPIIRLIKEWLGIQTPFCMQSDLQYDREAKKSELMLALTCAAGGNIYLSGRGAKKYMCDELFEQKGVKVEYQEFAQPEYKPLNANEFIPQLSLLDMLFSCGIEETKRAFWNNVRGRK